MTDRVRPAGRAADILAAWLTRHTVVILGVLVLAAVGLRALLVVSSPTPFGYIWDFYADGVQIFYDTGRVPTGADCWACGQPPVFFVLGWPFYAFGRWLSPDGPDLLAQRWLAGIALVAVAVTIYYTFALLRLFRCRGASLIAGMAVVLVFPCLFISSYGAEADIVFTAFASAFLFYTTRYFARRGSNAGWDAVLAGMLAGAAMATKYAGGVVVVTLAGMFAIRLLEGPRRGQVVLHAAVALSLCLVVGGWTYADNIRRYGTAFQTNGSSMQGLSLSKRRINREYSFTTFDLAGLRPLIGPRAEAGELTTFPIYNSVFTTLHALAWSDMSFFSIQSRHGHPLDPYPRKFIPAWLTLMVLRLGVIPGLIAFVGVIRSARHRTTWPLAVLVVVGLSAYVWWFLPQEAWALKTKYLLFLLPAYIVYFAIGLAWIYRKVPVVGLLVSVLVAALVGFTSVYLYAFAQGHL